VQRAHAAIVAVFGDRLRLAVDIHQQAVVQVFSVGARLPAEQFAHLAGGVVVVIERGHRLAELQVLGAEDGAARDGDAVVDDDARVFRNAGQRLQMARRFRS
jgi:hypothetical protein